MKWIKKGNLIAALAAVGLVWLLVFLFLDPLIKRALISAGQSAAGAKVEIDTVRTRLSRGSLEVAGVAVADRNAPMTNLVEFRAAVLRFSPGGALRAKAVIEDAAISGIRFGTPRKTSGALPFAGPSAFERRIAEQLAPAKEKAAKALEKAKDAKQELDPKKLASGEALDEAERRLKEFSEKAKDRGGADKIQARVKELQARVAELQKKGGSPAELAAKAQSAAKLQQDIKALLEEVKRSKEAVEQDYAEARAALARADELRKKDLQGLLSAAGVPPLDAETLTRRLIGPQAANKLATALKWIKWARERHAKSQKAKIENPPVARKGVNVEFPVKNALPAFLLRRAGLDARVEDLVGGRAMDLKGELLGVTSNPPLYGKPATLSLAGAAGALSMSLEARVDRTREDGPTEVRLRYSGFSLAGTSIGDEQIGAAITKGVGRLDGSVRVIGDAWTGRFVLDADAVSLEPKVALSGAAGRLTANALKGVERFTATIGVEGAGDELRVKVASDLGRALADAARTAATAELTAQRRELEKKLDAALAGRAQALNARAGDLRKTMLAPLDAQQRELEDQLRQAIAGAAPKVDLKKDLKKIFR